VQDWQGVGPLHDDVVSDPAQVVTEKKGHFNGHEYVGLENVPAERAAVVVHKEPVQMQLRLDVVAAGRQMALCGADFDGTAACLLGGVRGAAVEVQRGHEIANVSHAADHRCDDGGRRLGRRESLPQPATDIVARLEADQQQSIAGRRSHLTPNRSGSQRLSPGMNVMRSKATNSAKRMGLTARMSEATGMLPMAAAT